MKHAKEDKHSWHVEWQGALYRRARSPSALVAAVSKHLEQEKKQARLPPALNVEVTSCVRTVNYKEAVFLTLRVLDAGGISVVQGLSGDETRKKKKVTLTEAAEALVKELEVVSLPNILVALEDVVSPTFPLPLLSQDLAMQFNLVQSLPMTKGRMTSKCFHICVDFASDLLELPT